MRSIREKRDGGTRGPARKISNTVGLNTPTRSRFSVGHVVTKRKGEGSEKGTHEKKGNTTEKDRGEGVRKQRIRLPGGRGISCK